MPKCHIVDLEEPKVIKMSEMRPLQIGRVIDEGYSQHHLVWRTASTEKFEIVDLSAYGQDSCWTQNTEIKVRLLSPEEAVTIILTND